MSVTDFTRLHICRQSRQNKGFSDFRTLKKVYVGKSALGSKCMSVNEKTQCFQGFSVCDYVRHRKRREK